MSVDMVADNNKHHGSYDASLLLFGRSALRFRPVC